MKTSCFGLDSLTACLLLERNSGLYPVLLSWITFIYASLLKSGRGRGSLPSNSKPTQESSEVDWRYKEGNSTSFWWNPCNCLQSSRKATADAVQRYKFLYAIEDVSVVVPFATPFLNCHAWKQMHSSILYTCFLVCNNYDMKPFMFWKNANFFWYVKILHVGELKTILYNKCLFLPKRALLLEYGMFHHLYFATFCNSACKGIELLLLKGKMKPKFRRA